MKHKHNICAAVCLAMMVMTACSQINEKEPDIIPSVQAADTDVSETTTVQDDAKEPKAVPKPDSEESISERLFPVQAATISDDFDITIMTVTGVPYVAPENENIDNITPGDLSNSVNIDLTNVTVDEFEKAVYSYYDNDVYADMIHSDDNFYFKGVSFVTCKVEILDDDKNIPREALDRSSGENPYIKAVSTCEGTMTDKNLSFGGINEDMSREAVEAKLGKAYEQMINENETAAYYQNSKGALMIDYKYSPIYEAEYIDYIIVVVKDKEPELAEAFEDETHVMEE